MYIKNSIKYPKIFTSCAIIFVFLINSCQRSSIDSVVTDRVNSGRVITPESGINLEKVDESDELKDLTVVGDFEARGGILHFKSVSSFIATEEKLKKIKTEEKKSFINQPSFESMKEATDKANASVEMEIDKLPLEQILEKHRDVLESNGKSITNKSSLVHDDVINIEGMVYIGKILYRFTKDKEIIVFDNDLNKARNASNSSFRNDTAVRVFSTVDTDTLLTKKNASTPGARRADAPYCPEISWNKISADGQRKGSLRCYKYVDYFVTSGCYQCGNYKYTVHHQSISVGDTYKRSNDGTLFSYKTDHHMYISYNLQYYSILSNNQFEPITVSLGTINTYDYSVYWAQTLHSAYSVPEVDLNSYKTGYILFFQGNDYFTGYYYSTGVPDYLYMVCNNG